MRCWPGRQRYGCGTPDQRRGRGPAPTATQPAPDPATLQRLEDGVTEAGGLWQGFGLVFPNTLGRPMEPRWLLSDVYRPLLKRAGLPPITFHALRHTAATLLLAEGGHPKVVQELLGHAQVSTTLSRDSHMTPRPMSNAAALLDGEGPGSQAPDRF